MANAQQIESVIRRDMLSPNEISAFCAQITMILHSGISIGEGIGIMVEDMKNPQGKEILQVVHKHVDAGYPLFKALAACEKFPKYVVDMTEVGEATGKLENVMGSLVAYYEREESIAKSIRSAVTYPLIMIVMMLLVITVLVVKVMPIFNAVFLGLGAQMSGFSQSVLLLGELVGEYSFAIIGVIAAVILIFVFMRATSGGRTALENAKASFFLTRGLSANIASGRFASAMALMLASGLDTDQSLEMVYRLVDNPPVRKKIARCQELLAEGVPFSDALVKAGIFSGVYARMVTVAFKTGSLDSVMAKLAARYEDEVDTKISSIISIVEPTLVAILSIIVGMILLSVMLPLMGIMSSIG